MKKIAIALFILLIASMVFAVGCTNKESVDAMMEKDSMIEEKDSMIDKDDAMIESDSMEKDSMMESDDTMMLEVSDTLISGTSDTKYYEFEKKAYDEAIASGKIVLLNFYSSWCPVCKAEEPSAIAGFNELNNKNVVAFRVNYKDSATNDNEVDLAREFSITYQHTKVIIKDGERVVKSLESWSSERYVEELESVM